MRIRYVKTHVNVSRFKFGVCHEYDLTVVFDVTGCDRDRVLNFSKNWIALNYPGTTYQIVRSKNRPGYAYLKFTQGSDHHAGF